MDNKKIFKLGIVGNQGVGKTTLILRVAEKKFYEKVSCGVSVDFRTVKDYKVNGESVKLNIFDIAGLARNSDLAISFIKDASALALAFNLSALEYYNEDFNQGENLEQQIKLWTEKIYNNSALNIPVLILGCQLDKVQERKQILESVNDELERVLKDCHKLNIVKNKKQQLIYFPTSSKTEEGIDDFFQIWAQEACQIQKQYGSKLSNDSLIKKKPNDNDQCC